uniref:NADH dehydrogenase subunit 2 n=1 Tax=Margattea cuspidata TaxID=2829132 RepID=UPI0027A40F3E|nr:NADH dehydrogenase subunit 2 [Margattea cuspidata]WGO57353.1 NADH dehydrogenase subunit 2 [Margattea cuspidata]
MLKSSISTVFYFTLTSGIIITISSNSWMSAWMGLEINLLSFIPILMNNNNIFTTEAALKYFLIQTLASSSFLFFIISEILLEMIIPNHETLLIMIIISSPLMLKSGVAPLHWWFPSIMEGLNWNNCLVMMTLQKIAPIILLSLLLNNILMFSISLSSGIIGSIGGMNQLSIRKLMAYSSINHIGWMLSALVISENMWSLYFLIYSTLMTTFILSIKTANISFINQINLMNNNMWIPKFILFSSLLSLGGLPPFLGFFPKWIIIQNLMVNNMILQTLMMTLFSLITLFYYMRMCYSSLMILHSEQSWNMMMKIHMSSNYSFLLTITTIGLLISPMLIVFL